MSLVCHFIDSGWCCHFNCDNCMEIFYNFYNNNVIRNFNNLSRLSDIIKFSIGIIYNKIKNVLRFFIYIFLGNVNFL